MANVCGENVGADVRRNRTVKTAALIFTRWLFFTSYQNLFILSHSIFNFLREIKARTTFQDAVLFIKSDDNIIIS